MRIYLVGGAVRDQLRGVAPVDFDYVAVGGGERELRLKVPGLNRVGQGFAVFVRGNAQYTLSEFATIEEDLGSRDLTVNALARDEAGDVVAHPLALSDLREKILRPVALSRRPASPRRERPRFSSSRPTPTTG